MSNKRKSKGFVMFLFASDIVSFDFLCTLTLWDNKTYPRKFATKNRFHLRNFLENIFPVICNRTAVMLKKSFQNGRVCGSHFRISFYIRSIYFCVSPSLISHPVYRENFGILGRSIFLKLGNQGMKNLVISCWISILGAMVVSKRKKDNKESAPPTPELKR